MIFHLERLSKFYCFLKILFTNIVICFVWNWTRYFCYIFINNPCHWIINKWIKKIERLSDIIKSISVDSHLNANNYYPRKNARSTSCGYKNLDFIFRQLRTMGSKYNNCVCDFIFSRLNTKRGNRGI